MQDVGNQLRLIREEQGFTLEDVEKGTKIRRYYIDALERGDLDIMPGEVYTIGFAKSYGKFLGLDENEVSSVYKAYFSQVKMANNRQRNNENEGVIIRPEAKERRHARGDAAGRAATNSEGRRASTAYNGRPLKTRKNSFGSKFLWLILILVIVAAIIVLAVAVFGKDDAENPNPNPNANFGAVSTVDTNTPDVPDDQDKDDDPTPVVNNSVEAPIVLVMTVSGDGCNVNMNCDGTSSSEFLAAGTTTTYTGNEYIMVTYDNAPDVKVNLNGSDLGQVDNDNKKMRVNYVPEGVDYAMPLAD